MQATLQGRAVPDSCRITARIIGVIFRAGIVVYLAGKLLVQPIIGESDHPSTVSENSMMLAVGAMLMLMASVGDATHGVLMFPF